MKKIFLVGLILTIAMMASAALAGNVGWKVVFSIEGCDGTVEVGANDAGSGFHMLPITGVVSASLAGGYGAQIHLGSLSSFTETMNITPTRDYALTWRTYNWDPLWYYQEGDLLPQFKVVGLTGSAGLPNEVLDLTTSGTMRFSGDNPRFVNIYAGKDTSAVPEPSSLLGIGGGLICLGGFLRRRR